ncbi:hypothetical protein CCFV1_ORF067 [Cotesia congregata filamentous virus 1]|uniref:Uncharacterized protein n=1 Tax=Cotesia congregata filamentous virus 1 TaxID=3064291 RepID=A0ABC8QJP1_9VIRU|nr:hypothetical protein CCFV1_ORF067 [Cotesia congregata filamentous virus 1]
MECTRSTMGYKWSTKVNTIFTQGPRKIFYLNFTRERLRLLKKMPEWRLVGMALLNRNRCFLFKNVNNNFKLMLTSSRA